MSDWIGLIVALVCAAFIAWLVPSPFGWVLAVAIVLIVLVAAFGGLRRRP